MTRSIRSFYKKPNLNGTRDPPTPGSRLKRCAEPEGRWEEYRYDALGRRVLVRSLPNATCLSACQPHFEITLWEGAQILHERRWSDASTPGIPHRITYTHGPGVDLPLSLRSPREFRAEQTRSASL